MPDPRSLVERWLHDCVLALELCPFAAPVLREDSLRIAVSDAAEFSGQLRDFLAELDFLQTSAESEVSTSLLVFTRGPEDFDQFLQLIASAGDLVEEAGLSELVQLAHFHPHYQFANEPTGALSHFSNRSPLPVIHLLRESMMTRVLSSYPDPAVIPRRNVARLEAMGREQVEQLWQGLWVDRR